MCSNSSKVDVFGLVKIEHAVLSAIVPPIEALQLIISPLKLILSPKSASKSYLDSLVVSCIALLI